MTTHLPECFLSSATCPNSDLAHPPTGGACTHCGGVCICNRLRACEARVGQRIDVMLAKAIDYGERTALDAARDAVAALPDWKFCDAVCGTERSVLAAIDALRGDPVT